MSSSPKLENWAKLGCRRIRCLGEPQLEALGFRAGHLGLCLNTVAY